MMVKPKDNEYKQYVSKLGILNINMKLYTMLIALIINSYMGYIFNSNRWQFYYTKKHI